MSSTVIVETGLCTRPNLLVVVLIQICLLFLKMKMEVSGYQIFSVWTSWKIRYVHLGFLLLDLRVTILCLRNGLSMGRYHLFLLYSYIVFTHTFLWQHPCCTSSIMFFLQLVCSGSCAGPSDEISPLYSLWATFVGLYIANFVVERSTGYAFTVLHYVYAYWCLLLTP